MERGPRRTLLPAIGVVIAIVLVIVLVLLRYILRHYYWECSRPPCLPHRQRQRRRAGEQLPSHDARAREDA